jgi:hypothetical protein
LKPYHFYVAFNPLFNQIPEHRTQAHEFYHKLKNKKANDPDAFLYWGKIKLSEFSQHLKIENYKRVIKENEEVQLDTHIYVTDYQYLWVGKVSEATEVISSYENTLSFYENKQVEAWFKITDFDLVSNDAKKTLQMMSKFFVDNEYYDFKLKEINPFSASVRFPMIIQDSTYERYFRNSQHKSYSRILENNNLITEASTSIEINGIIPTYVISEEHFKLLPESVRSEIFHAEILIIEAQASGKKDRYKLEQAILTYLKVLETILNKTFVEHLKVQEGHRIYVTKDDPPKFLRSALDRDKTKLMRLRDCQLNFNLSQIKMLLDTTSFFGHTSLDYIFRTKKEFWEYCRLELRATLKNESLVELRNTLTTPDHLNKHERELLLVRNILLGVSGKGVINQILKTYYGSQESSSKVA